MTDAQLVLAARAGDRAAFAALVERHHAALRRACRRALRDREAADEAGQEAVLTALTSLGRLREPERFGSWLIGIGLNLARREWRAATARPRAPLEDHAQQGGADPFDCAAGREVAALVRRALAALPPGQRAAAELFYLGGLGHAEIAQALGISVAAVKTRLHKARAALRGRLADLREEPAVSDRIPARVTDVRRDGDHHVVILEAGDRRLPIWVGAPEGTALAILLEDVELPRPHTHQFAAALLRAAGGRVREVRVSRLLASIFYATVVLADGKEVDARPSDALALALVESVPITVEPEVLDDAERSEVPGELLAVLDSPAGARVIADETRARLAELPRP